MLFKRAEEQVLSQWEQIKDSFAGSVNKMFPISGRKNTLELVNLTYDDSKNKESDIKSQQLAKEQEKTWGIPVFGEFILRDKETGNVINKSRQKIAVLPKMTQRFTYIIGGGEYNSAYQQRIKSGIYSKVNEKGEHLAEINLNGRNNAFVKEARLKIPFDLEKKKFNFSYATNNIPLYSMLKCVGVSDEDMKKTWGEDIWKANAKKNWQADIQKMYDKKWKGRGLVVGGDSFEHIQNAVTEALAKSAVLPETTKLTLGRPIEKLNGDVLLETSLHVLKTARGEKSPDDMGSMVFKQLLGLDDFIAEKFGSPKTGMTMKQKIRNNVDRKDKISSIISSDLFSKPLAQVFYSNALSQRPDQTNPLDILASKSQVTSMGPGGITSTHQLRPGMKMVNQTHMGFVDPLVTPEGEATGISLHLPIGVRKIGKEAKAYVYDMQEKKFVYRNPAEVHGEWTASPDQITWKNGEPVPVKPSIVAMSPETHEFVETPFSKIKYVIPSPRHLFSESANAIPFLQCNQGNRTMTGSRQPTQGVSLVHREAPLVQVKSNTKDSFEKVFGSAFSHSAPEDGKIVDIVKDKLGHTDEIHVEDTKGQLHKVQIYNHFPLNEKKTYIHAEPNVSVGDVVKKGQTIADTNFSQSGVLATGVNLRTGYVNYYGNTYEDSVVISESAAKKLSSTHLHRPTLETNPGDIVSLNKYLAYASSAGKKITKDRLQHLDTEGIIKPGTRVKPGDILVAAVGKNEVPEDLAKLGARLKGAILPYRDKSLVWDNEHEGEVIKVVKKPGETGYSVHVKTVEPMRVGDKLAARHGDKNIVGAILPDEHMPRVGGPNGPILDMLTSPTGVNCHDDKTEILTRNKGWILFKDLTKEDIVATCNPKDLNFEWQSPDELHEYDYSGKMYLYEGQQHNFCVTPNHNMWAAKRKKKGSMKFSWGAPHTFDLIPASECFGITRRMLKATNWKGEDPEYFVVPEGTKKHNTPRVSPSVKVPSILWAEFIGWFVAEGSTYANGKGVYQVTVSQSKEANPEKYAEITKLIRSMGFKCSQEKDNIAIRHKGLYELLAPLGKAAQKHIPREVLDLPTTHLKALFDAYIKGDGHVEYKNGKYRGTKSNTISKELADDLQEVAMKLGISMNIYHLYRDDFRGGVSYICGYSYKAAAGWTNPRIKSKRRNKEEWVDYTGKVYCAAVKNGLLITRREKKVLVSGNSRINLGQMLELSASKIANKTGKPYVTNNFQHGVDYAEKLRQEMKQHGLSDTDTIYDPLLKESLENPVMTGHKYIFKLKHQVEKKESVRGMDQSLARKYSINEDPSRGGGEGAQAIAQLDMYALLAHGARANLKEMTSYKAERQHNSETMADTDFWNRIMLGLPLQPPKATFAYKKFEGMLQGMGLNLKKEGYDTVLTPLTDKGVLHLSAGEITSSKKLRGKDDLEIAGGLFDKKITGGTSGKLHSHISLAEPFPNPLFVGTKAQPGPAVVLSGLKYDDFEKVVHGEKHINIAGKEITGGKAINELLKKVDVNKEFEKTKEELKNLSGTVLDKANKKAKFLRALKNLNMKPHEAYVMNQFPVIPPIFRPVTPMGDGSTTSADINTLYAHIIQDNNALKDKETLKYNPELYQKLNAAVYDKLKAAVGIGSVPLYEGNKELKGLAHSIAGDNPKTGFFQNKIMKRRQDLSMRSTITPAPDLQMDQVGIPRDSAMALYKPFVIRTLIQSGKDLIEATKEVKEQTPMAWKALEHTIKERPVLIKRDPVLHKYNIQAYYPVLKEGKSIGLHPLACAGANADYDGDQNLSLIIIYMNKESREEIERNFSGKCWYNIYGNKVELTNQYFEERKMPFINQSLPIIDNNGDFYVLNMADFPRGDLVHEDADKKFYTVPEGIHVISYDQYTLEPKLAKVTHTSVHSKKEVYIVNMSGRKQSFVDDDPRAVYGYDPDLRIFGRWRPEESIGKLVPCVKHFEVVGGKTELRFDKTKIKRIKEVVPLNDETGYFIGCLVGDGWAASKQVVLANIEPEVVNKYKRGMDFFIENAHLSSHESEHTPFGLSAPIKHARHSLNAAGFEDLIGEWIGKGAQNKRLPPFTFSSCREFRMGVLAGLIDTDGSMSISHGKAKPQFMCNLSTTSIQLTLDVVALCRSLNVNASVTAAKTPKGNDCWVITFSSGDLYLLDLTVVNPDRLTAWNYLKTGDNPRETPSFISQDIIPFHPEYRDILRRISRCNTVDNGVSLGVSVKNSADRRYITRQCAKTVLHHLWSSFTQEELTFLDPLIKMVLQEGITWEIVESVERTGVYEEGFDITVPETETFCGADFVVRSNTMAVYLPLTEEARKEAIDKMLPSKNLFSSTNYGIMHAPDQESIIGLHLATFWGGKKDKMYGSLQDIVNDKTLHRSDVVKYKIGGVEKETTKGRALLASHLPSEFPQDKKDKLLHDSSFNFKKGSIHDYLESAARVDKKNHPNLVDGWRNVGNETAYRAGFSFSLEDLKPNKELRDKILNPYHAEVAKVRASSLGAQEKDDKAIELYGKATKDLEKEFTEYYRNKNNHMHKMVDIKARGNFGQFRQTVIAPMLMADNNGVIPEPVTKSYSEGLSVDQYWKTLYGARMGTLSRAQGTSVPGALAKELSNINVATTIASHDCGTTKGHNLNLIGHDGREEIDITDRYLAKDVTHNNLHIKAGTFVTPDLFAKMKHAGVQKVEVRSPLGCKDPVGICQKCIGASSEGTHHEIGTNIGMLASQALSEPAIQIAMDSTVTLTMIKIKIDTEEEHLTIGEFFEKC